MAIQIVFTPELWWAIVTLVKFGIDMSGTHTDEEIIQRAKDEEARSDALQKRQEGTE